MNLASRVPAQAKQLVRRIVPHALLYLPRALQQHRPFLKTHLLDAVDQRFALQPARVHLEAAMQWLARAQDATGTGGVSASWSEGAWQPAYPETTGYIIETLFDYARLGGDTSFATRAIRAATWLLGLQLPGGAFPAGSLANDTAPAVFNTGQIIFGLCRAYRETNDDAFLNAAIAAGDWLGEIQEPDGSWMKGLTPLANNPVHTYNARVAWSLAELYAVTQQKRFSATATRNIDWTLTQQRSNGWLDNVATNTGAQPITHFIAYTIRGVLECGRCLDNEQYVDAARRSLRRLLDNERGGHLPVQYARDWHPVNLSTCLTGNAQTAVICQQLYTMTRDAEFLPAAQRLVRYLMSTQDLTNDEPGIRGGIKGSHPVFGYYAPYVILNWATKFFAEALLGHLAIAEQRT